jgi:hypothetical protein
MHRLENDTKVPKLLKNAGTALNAINRRCLDCSGGSKPKVRQCPHLNCPLHPFRLGKNPNRRMSEEQRVIAAARLARVRRRLDGT